MTLSTASDLSLLDNLERQITANVSVSLLAELERELLRLRCELTGSAWKSLCDAFPKRNIFTTLRQGNLTSQRLSQSDHGIPAGVLDVVMADSFPARESIAPSPAHLVSAWEYSLPASRSIRARKSYFAREIAEVIRTSVKPRILALGAGQMREADDSLRLALDQNVEFIAIEPDPARAAPLERKYARNNLQVAVTSWDTLAHLQPHLGQFDLIYSPSWLDLMPDAQAASWLSASLEMLRSGGKILAANFAPGTRDAGWMEACWNWHPCYRTEEDLVKLVTDLKHPDVRGLIRGHAIFRDESGASAFLELYSI